MSDGGREERWGNVWVVAVCSKCGKVHAGRRESCVVEYDSGAGDTFADVERVEAVRLSEALREWNRGFDACASELEQAREALSEIALRLADVASIADQAGDSEDVDVPSMLSALDYALRGDSGCIEPEEWHDAREAALAKHADYLALASGAVAAGDGGQQHE